MLVHSQSSSTGCASQADCEIRTEGVTFKPLVSFGNVTSLGWLHPQCLSSLPELGPDVEVKVPFPS